MVMTRRSSCRRNDDFGDCAGASDATMSSGTYRIEAGKLREDLACMIANFKQVITNQEILASGALVYIESRTL